MTFKEKYGGLALIAGASEGLGAAFAHHLASRGLDVMLVARRKEKLQEMGDEIRQAYGVNVYPITCDLAKEGALEIILQGVGIREVDVVVYNAAHPFLGSFLNCSDVQLEEMTMVNIVTQQKIVKHFGGGMVRRGRGGIILMSSLAGFQGSGFLAAYAASKAYCRVLAESLWYEWRAKGVDVIACCAGATATPNYINSLPKGIGYFSPRVQTPEEVVKACFQQLGRLPSVITGAQNRIASFFMSRILSRKRAVVIMGDTTRKMYSIPELPG